MQDLLSKNSKQEAENIIYETTLHWIMNIPSILSMMVGSISLPITLSCILRIITGRISFGFLEIIALAFTLLFIKGLYGFFLNKSFRIIITEKQLTLISGIFSKNITDISLKKYEGLHLHQSFLGKQLNFGSLYITTGGASQSYKIKNPLELRKHIVNQLS